MTRAAPKCRTCGNHPRSKAHVESCGLRVKEETVQTDSKSPPANWVLGSTCLQCRITYTHTPMPDFQDPDTKHGKYDVLKQLPKTAPDYPLCATCLAWSWRSAAGHWGMVKQVKEVYGDMFSV